MINIVNRNLTVLSKLHFDQKRIVENPEYPCCPFFAQGDSINRSNVIKKYQNNSEAQHLSRDFSAPMELVQTILKMYGILLGHFHPMNNFFLNKKGHFDCKNTLSCNKNRHFDPENTWLRIKKKQRTVWRYCYMGYAAFTDQWFSLCIGHFILKLTYFKYTKQYLQDQSIARKQNHSHQSQGITRQTLAAGENDPELGGCKVGGLFIARCRSPSRGSCYGGSATIGRYRCVWAWREADGDGAPPGSSAVVATGWQDAPVWSPLSMSGPHPNSRMCYVLPVRFNTNNNNNQQRLTYDSFLQRSFLSRSLDQRPHRSKGILST